MAHAPSIRLRRLFAIAAAGFWLGGLLPLWAIVRPAPRPLAAALLGSYFLSWGAVLILAPPPRWRAIARFTLTTLALALTLGGLELVSAIGIVDYRTVLATGGPDPRKNADNVLDPELIHIHKPYLRRVGATRGDIALALHLAGTPLYPYDVACDRNGFRNARDLSTAELVVLGDSFVEGGLVAADDLMTTTLSQLLGCTVANLGQSAYGPQQELAVLKRFGASLRPRLCIWTFYGGNDLDDVERYDQLRQQSIPTAVRSTPRERSFGRNALQVLSERLGPYFTPDPAGRAPWGTLQNEDGRTTQLFFDYRGAQLSSRGLAALDKAVSVLSAAHTACVTNRVPLLVVFVPEKFRVYRDYCTFRPDNPCVDWVLDDLPGQLGARITALGPGISFLDLTPALAREAARGRLLYFADDTHWSAEGHQVAGRAIAAYITRQSHLGLPAEQPRVGRTRLSQGRRAPAPIGVGTISQGCRRSPVPRTPARFASNSRRNR